MGSIFHLMVHFASKLVYAPFKKGCAWHPLADHIGNYYAVMQSFDCSHMSVMLWKTAADGAHDLKLV